MSKRKNTNCLQGLQCKSCDSLGPFDIVAKALFHRVTDNGTDEYSGVEWDLNSPCKCCECDHHGCIEDFTTQEKLKLDKPFSVLLDADNMLGTYYDFVMAQNPTEAVQKAKANAAGVTSVAAQDFIVLLVLDGHHEHNGGING